MLCAWIASDCTKAVEMSALLLTETFPPLPPPFPCPPIENTPPAAPPWPPPPPIDCARIPMEQPVPQVGSSPCWGAAPLSTPVRMTPLLSTFTGPPSDPEPPPPPSETMPPALPPSPPAPPTLCAKIPCASSPEVVSAPELVTLTLPPLPPWLPPPPCE